MYNIIVHNIYMYVLHDMYVFFFLITHHTSHRQCEVLHCIMKIHDSMIICQQTMVSIVVHPAIVQSCLGTLYCKHHLFYFIFLYLLPVTVPP